MTLHSVSEEEKGCQEKRRAIKRSEKSGGKPQKIKRLKKLYKDHGKSNHQVTMSKVASHTPDPNAKKEDELKSSKITDESTIETRFSRR